MKHAFWDSFEILKERIFVNCFSKGRDISKDDNWLDLITLLKVRKFQENFNIDESKLSQIDFETLNDFKNDILSSHETTNPLNESEVFKNNFSIGSCTPQCINEDLSTLFQLTSGNILDLSSCFDLISVLNYCHLFNLI